jgi:hypothetical protein
MAEMVLELKDVVRELMLSIAGKPTAVPRAAATVRARGLRPRAVPQESESDPRFFAKSNGARRRPLVPSIPVEPFGPSER